ncbi:TonB-dependent receptor domain-containing protein [Paraglaciecola marina]|uniref:TonB-dependent receptor domain-containing protein n=1 Tax=Paraglaciecola marina TaxID=2500157 RepID=UPI00105E8B51|nr:TonB-dependent receptor [Paraglaciecola marina]
MKINKTFSKAGLAAFPLCLLSTIISTTVSAQDQLGAEINQQIGQEIERVLVRGRLQTAAESIVTERIESDKVVDILGIEQISRAGDSNIADALRRVPGLTLVDGKFIYIRGLGERYQNVTLNGAAVPSPDLTRNVIPLDIFPTAIVADIAVQKGYTADKSAVFGGGAIDIRTTAIPDSFMAYVGASGGINSLSDSYLDYPGSNDFGKEDGTRAFPSIVSSTLGSTFINDGDLDISPSAIQDTANRNGSAITFEQAEALNRELALGFNRDLDISEKDSSVQDMGFEVGIGDTYDIGGEFTLGGLVTLNYDESIRTQDRISRRLEEPEEEFTETTKSTQNTSVTVTAAVALKWGYDHSIESKNFFIRNTDDETFVSNEYNDTSGFSSGGGFRNYEGIFEQRELEINQFSGRHILGEDTRDLIGLDSTFLDDLELTWFYSDSNATTEIPNAFTSVATFSRDTTTNEFSNVNISLGGIVSNGLQFDNLDLDDQLESSGFEMKLPLYAGDWAFELSGGTRIDKRGRISDQLTLTIDGSSIVNSLVTDSISTRFSDEAISNADNGFELALESSEFSPSLAATKVEAVFGQINIDWNDELTVVLGSRFEDYRQVSAIFNPLAVSSPILPNLDSNSFTEGELPEGIFQDDGIYPSASAVYKIYDFWAETFKLNLMWSENVIRPDMREIVDTSFRDPVTDFIISGNSSVTPSDITNIDLRAEWFFESGNNFTVSLFHKDIENPIELFSQTATGNELRAEVLNAGTAEISGLEVEWMVNLEFLGDIGSLFFVQGNITSLFNNEIDATGVESDVTNAVRPLTQASDFVANIIVGFDSDDGKHSAGLAFNTFSERLYVSGASGFADSYEQPFDSLDFNYTYYIQEDLSVKFKAKNLLDAKNEITQENNDGVDVTRFEQEVGQGYSVSVSYKF